MALPRRVRALLPAALSMVLAAGAALAVSRPPDPLDGVKTSIRLKNFAAAATELQKLAAAGNPDAQYLLAVFYLNGVNGPRHPATAKTWLEKALGIRIACRYWASGLPAAASFCRQSG